MNQVATTLLDHKKRRIHVKVLPNGKSVFFVKRAGGKKSYGNKAMFRKHGANGKVTKVVSAKTVPAEVRSMNMLPRNEATVHRLEAWHTRLFEHFGWMIMAKAKGQGYKVKNYKKSIKEFLKTAQKNLNRSNVKILWKQVMVLKNHANML